MKIEQVTRRAQEQLQMVLEEQSRYMYSHYLCSILMALSSILLFSVHDLFKCEIHMKGRLFTSVFFTYS